MNTSIERARREGHVLLHDVDWAAYEAMLSNPEAGQVRLTYDQETLEIQERSFTHERDHRTLRYVVNALADAFKMPTTMAGTTTLKREDLRCGLDPDASYYTTHREAFAQAMREKSRGINLLVIPPPDLAIEVDDSTSTLDRLDIFARIGVPEVWRRSGDRLRIYQLEPDGSYRKSKTSPTFPFIPLEETIKVLLRNKGVSDTSLIHSLQQWVRDSGSAKR